MGVGWTVRMRHVVWLLLLWLVAGVHLLFLVTDTLGTDRLEDGGNNGVVKVSGVTLMEAEGGDDDAEAAAPPRRHLADIGERPPKPAQGTAPCPHQHQPRLFDDAMGGESWQPVRTDQSFVFSAYHDPRVLVVAGETWRRGVVRVVGLTDTHVDGAPQYCRLWYRNPGSSTMEDDYNMVGGSGGRGYDVVAAVSDIVPETHGLRFAAFLYTCRLTTDRVPLAVSLTHARCDPPLNYLPVVPAIVDGIKSAMTGSKLMMSGSNIPSSRRSPRYGREQLDESEKEPETRNSYNRTRRSWLPSVQHRRTRRQANLPNDYVVCVTPFNFRYNDVWRLIEKVETDAMFGASRFIFYNYSTGPDLDRYLHHYRKEGMAEVVQWQLPVAVDPLPISLSGLDTGGERQVAVHYFGQLAALNDCLYRNQFSAQMVVFTDMDETIVPHRHATWRDMLQGTVGGASFVFQNAFFRTEWPDDPDTLSNHQSPLAINEDSNGEPPVLSLHKTLRERYLYPWGMRSKYMADPLKVEMVGVHNIWRFVNDTSGPEVEVPPDLGLLHHYRSWGQPQPTNAVRDRRMQHFTATLLKRMRQRQQKLRGDLKAATTKLKRGW